MAKAVHPYYDAANVVPRSVADKDGNTYPARPQIQFGLGFAITDEPETQTLPARTVVRAGTAWSLPDVKTENYEASIGELVRVDLGIASFTVTITLPEATPANKGMSVLVSEISADGPQLDPSDPLGPGSKYLRVACAADQSIDTGVGKVFNVLTQGGRVHVVSTGAGWTLQSA